MTERMTAIQFREMHRKEKKEGRIKGARRTRVGDIEFDSALEAARYAELLLMQKAGKIENLKCQVKIPLQGAQGPLLTPTGRQMHYRADFTYRDEKTGESVIEDAKGHRTDRYQMKLSALNAMGISVREITKSKKRRKA